MKIIAIETSTLLGGIAILDLNYIDGRLVAPIAGQYLDNYDPAIGEVYPLVPDSDPRDIDRAVATAERAFPKWSTTPA